MLGSHGGRAGLTSAAASVNPYLYRAELSEVQYGVYPDGYMAGYGHGDPYMASTSPPARYGHVARYGLVSTSSRLYHI